MDTLAMELCPGTAKYRQSRLLWWHSMRYLYEDYVDDAMKHGSPLVAAEDAASKNQRGQTRALISELLTQAPVFSIVAFLAIVGDVSDPAAPFKHSKAVDDLIESMYPRRPWATKTVKFAGGADDARWSAWLTGWAEEFAATGTEARDAMTPPGRAGGGLGLAAGFTTLLRWAPYIIAGSGLTQRFLNEHERQHLEDRRTVTPGPMRAVRCADSF